MEEVQKEQEEDGEDSGLDDDFSDDDLMDFKHLANMYILSRNDKSVYLEIPTIVTHSWERILPTSEGIYYLQF